MFFKAKLWSLSTWHWQSHGKMAVYQAFCYGEATHNFEIQECSDLGVLE